MFTLICLFCDWFCFCLLLFDVWFGSLVVLHLLTMVCLYLIIDCLTVYCYIGIDCLFAVCYLFVIFVCCFCNSVVCMVTIFAFYYLFRFSCLLVLLCVLIVGDESCWLFDEVFVVLFMFVVIYYLAGLSRFIVFS